MASKFNWVRITNGQLDTVREAYKAVVQSHYDRETEEVERLLAEVERVDSLNRDSLKRTQSKELKRDGTRVQREGSRESPCCECKI